MPHFCISETTHFVGRAAATLAADPDVSRWNGRSLTAFELSQEYGFTDLDGTQPDSWQYTLEVTLPGRARWRRALPAAARAATHWLRRLRLKISTEEDGGRGCHCGTRWCSGRTVRGNTARAGRRYSRR